MPVDKEIEVKLWKQNHQSCWPFWVLKQKWCLIPQKTHIHLAISMYQQFVELFWLVLWSAFMLFFCFLSPCSIKQPVPILQLWVCYFILSFYHGSFWNFHRFRNTAEGERLAVIAYLPLHCILEVGDSKGEIFIWDIILHHPCIWALSVGIRARNREQGKELFVIWAFLAWLLHWKWNLGEGGRWIY